MRLPTCSLLLRTAGFLAAFASARGAEEYALGGDVPVRLIGDFVHRGDDIVGPRFEVVVAGLLPGPYTVLQPVGRRYKTDVDARGVLVVKYDGQGGDAHLKRLEIRDLSTDAVVLVTPASFAALPAWRDPEVPAKLRLQDLLRRMTLPEKVSQIRNDAPAIPRLGIPSYNYWSEALHGVADAGVATVFPQAIAMAATWDPTLIRREGETIATEGRAKYNDYSARHDGNARGRYGLTFWSPNVNIFRDPRWGRGQETYGEDPYLTGSLAVAFIRGLQGDDPREIKAMACAKHFAVHSGPEPLRHRFDVRPPERDLYETYFPQFEMAVREGHVGGVMGAYNALDGVPACASSFLLRDTLRRDWGFEGYVVSDCGAIHNIFAEHKYVRTVEEAAAVAVKAGCNICCGKDYDALVHAVSLGLITEAEIDRAVSYALQSRFQLGLFDPRGLGPFDHIGMDQNDTPAHEALAERIAEKSIVLLKNEGVLPLRRGALRRIAVIGENAASLPVLVGNYNGNPRRPVTLLDGIRAAAGSAVSVTYARGCPLALLKDGSNRPTPADRAEAVAAARGADLIVYVGGISAELEGEENTRANGFDGFDGGDRTRIELPAVQTELLQALAATGKPVVFVNCSGCAMAMPWEAAHLPAIVQAWYPGEQGGRAVAAILFGDANPAGRLPITVYRATADLPGFESYDMRGRTYRYFSGQPLYAFGHGLSYSHFDYGSAKLTGGTTLSTDATARVTLALTNGGARAGDEVVQVYYRHVHSAEEQPRLALCAYQRVGLKAGESQSVTLEVPAQRLRYWSTAKHAYSVEPGDYEFLIGAASDDIRQRVAFSVR